MKITNEVLEGYLNCKLKAHLREVGEQGIRTDYVGPAPVASRRGEAIATEKILARQGEGQVARSIALTADSLKSGPPFVLDALFEDDLFCLKIDGLKKVPGPSRLGAFHYVPVLFHGGEKVRREQTAPAGTAWPAAGRRAGAGPITWSRLARQGVPQLAGRSEAWPGRAVAAATAADSGRRAAEADPERPLPGLRVPAAVPRAGGEGGQPQPAAGTWARRRSGV